MANDPEQRLAFIEAELAAYRDENDRLAQELVLARRVIAMLPFAGAKESGDRAAASRRLSRLSYSGGDIVFHVDRCEGMDRVVHIAGWAFCPRIDCGEGRLSLLLESPEETLLVHPKRVLRADVAAAHEKADLDPCGFSVLLERDQLASGRAYKVAIQIDGPTFSVRKLTGSVLNA